MRNRHFLLADVLLLAGLPFLVLSLRFESLDWPADTTRAALLYGALVLPMRVAVAQATGLYRCLWRHASITELQRVLYAGGLAGAGSVLLGTLGLTATGLSPVRLPYSALVLDAVLTLGVFAGPRLFARYAGRRASRSG